MSYKIVGTGDLYGAPPYWSMRFETVQDAEKHLEQQAWIRRATLWETKYARRKEMFRWAEIVPAEMETRRELFVVFSRIPHHPGLIPVPELRAWAMSREHAVRTAADHGRNVDELGVVDAPGRTLYDKIVM